MPSQTLTQKLRIQPGRRIAVLNAPPGYVAELGEMPETTQIAMQPEGTFDLVHLFVHDSAELDRAIDAALGALTPNGLLWISYPKGTSRMKSDLNRDRLWSAMEQRGYTGVTLISLNDVWSAMRFRPADRAGSTSQSARGAALDPPTS